MFQSSKKVSYSIGAVAIGFFIAFMPVNLAEAGGHQHGGYGQEEGVSPAAFVPLFPVKVADLKKGLPPGMTQASFQAARGTAALTKLPSGKTKVEFNLSGLIPYGVYTLWNVLSTSPFKDEPFGEFGAGKHSVVADGHGDAHKVVYLSKWVGKAFLLDYHADGKLSQSKGVFPGALAGEFPKEPKR